MSATVMVFSPLYSILVFILQNIGLFFELANDFSVKVQPTKNLILGYAVLSSVIMSLTDMYLQSESDWELIGIEAQSFTCFYTIPHNLTL